jgi:hypothetical protein
MIPSSGTDRNRGFFEQNPTGSREFPTEAARKNLRKMEAVFPSGKHSTRSLRLLTNPPSGIAKENHRQRAGTTQDIPCVKHGYRMGHHTSLGNIQRVIE